MGDALWTLLHLFGDAALLYAAGRSSLAAFVWKRSKRHDAVMRRLAVLERDLGLGIDWAREWVDRQKVTTDTFGYSHQHGRQWCTLCGKMWEAWTGKWGNEPHPLCPTCEKEGAVSRG